MEAVIFMGVQASGKSSFYKEKYFNSHVRIAMDLLHTRNKEKRMLNTCLELQQQVVIDNTNPRKEDRRRYIEVFKRCNYKIIGFYFQSNVADCLKRNENRTGKEKIPRLGILGTYKKLELPVAEEGYDALYYVELANNTFVVKEFEYAI